MTKDVVVRRATAADLPAIGGFAGELVRLHHATDPRRFLLVPVVDSGYAWWLGKEIANASACVLAGLVGGQLAGYAYGTLEDRNWNDLLDAHGKIHDVFVASAQRRSGLGGALVAAMIKELEVLGAPRIVLSRMEGNEAAQQLFAAHGFRKTMVEMTRGG
ncbi:MAG: acetyltransferase [Myxococcaceae bacterium]|nr:acetyltransferase [Myxococcaceae bacterium]